MVVPNGIVLKLGIVTVGKSTLEGSGTAELKSDGGD